MYVRSVNADGTLRIQIAGADITARSEMPGGFNVAPGSLLKGIVSFEDGRIYIKLLPGSLRPESPIFSFLASNGLPESPPAVFTASFFYASGKRLVPAEIKRIVSLAGDFPGKEFRACEAASLLSQKGIPLTAENLRIALEILEGRDMPLVESVRDSLEGEGSGAGGYGNSREGSGGGEPEKKGNPSGWEFSRRFVSGDYESDYVWYIYPYRRDFAGQVCTGSLRFLFDRLSRIEKESRLTFVDGHSSADFILTGDACRFEIYPGSAPRLLEKFTGEIKKMMMASGLDMDVFYGFDETLPGGGTVDIEV